jgi:DNA (cytosine-5)-methyltransferase 1
MRLLSLCTGYGGLDLAVEAFFDCELVACAEIDKYASLAIDKHFAVPNLGDIKAIDWSSLTDIDIMTAGYPCQPFSHAGHRKGTEDVRHIWPHIKEGISIIRPSIVVLENVRGHLSLGFKEVLQELTEIGYDAVWTVVRASDVGAPHQRARLFIIAYTNGNGREISTKRQQSSQSQSHGISTQESSTNSNSHACKESRRVGRGLRSPSSQIIDGTDRQINGCCGSKDVQHPDAISQRFALGNNNGRSQGNQGKSQSEPFFVDSSCCNTNDQQIPSNGQMSKLGRRFDTRLEMSMRSVPNPLVDGKLNTKFVEYMMGLPEGWVTDLPISRAQQFKMLGNGVVPQQAFRALEILWTMKGTYA